MSRAATLSLANVRPSSGRCPWRIDFAIDGSPVSAFFRPPDQIREAVTESDVTLIALPILCDLAAEVRPKTVRVDPSVAAPSFGGIFRDAIGALLAEQDAFWARKRWTDVPSLSYKTLRPPRSRTKLSHRRIILGFSGGKDSVVSLFALREAGYEVIPVLLNEGDRTWQDLRKWIPKLRGLGLDPHVAYLCPVKRGGLNRRYGDGHFSSYQIGWLTAVLAICAVRSGAGTICLGIEHSADHTNQTIRGKRVNHQHQKTTRHLISLERLYRRALHDGLRLASPIAECSDADVIRILLERVPPKYRAFSSCGGANSSSKHCGECEKCAFVYALLSASHAGRRLAKRIFRNDLLEEVDVYRPWIDARFNAPLACIGEPVEVWDVLESLGGAGQDSAVVRRWMRSSVRRNDYLPRRGNVRRERKHSAQFELAGPVSQAAKLIHRWLRTHS